MLFTSSHITFIWTVSVSVSDKPRVTGPPSDPSPPSHGHGVISGLLHVRHRHHPVRARGFGVRHHHHPRLPQTQEAVEEPEEVRCITDAMHSSLFTSASGFQFLSPSLLSAERWRPRRWVLFHPSSCWIDSTPTPCTRGFPCCWTQSCWPWSIPEIISSMSEISEREPSDGFSKPGERGRR